MWMDFTYTTVCIISVSCFLYDQCQDQLPTLAPTQREYCSVQMIRVKLLGAKSETRLGDMPNTSRQSSA